MDKFLLNKYGGLKINKVILNQLIKDIKNYKDPPPPAPFTLNNEQVIEEIKKFKNKKTDKPLSKATYNNYIKMFNDMNKAIPNILQQIINNQNDKTKINEIFDKIKNQDWLVENRKEINQGRSINYLIFLNQLITNLPNLKEQINSAVLDKLNKFIKEMKTKVDDLQDYKTSYEDLKIKWPEFLEKTEELTNKSNTPIRDKILYNLYKNLPLRDDFGNVKFLEEDLKADEIVNYYNIKTNKLHIRDYKSNAQYGNKVYDIPAYLIPLIQKQASKNKYLITRDNGELYKNGKLTDYIRKNSKNYFGKSITIDDIRHSIVAYYDENKSQAKRRQLAQIMLHSLDTANTKYTRRQMKK